MIIIDLILLSVNLAVVTKAATKVSTSSTLISHLESFRSNSTKANKVVSGENV